MQVPKRKPGKYTNQPRDLHLTSVKIKEFKIELDQIKRVVRPRLISEVKRLAELGDFSENTEYQIAKYKLRGINSRITELEEAIRHGIVISTSGQNYHIKIGHRVNIEMDGQQKSYQILGSTETDPTKGIVSHTSPLGVALVGKRVGESFTVRLGSKEVRCKILKIK